MDPFVDQLKGLCTAHPTRSKWVFVPTHAIGRTLGERLALEGTNWLNLRFVTPLDIALRMGAPFLVERGIDPSEEGLGPALMMRLLLDLPSKGGYFRPLADHPTLAQALWTTVRELRMAGVRARRVQARGVYVTRQARRARRAALGLRTLPGATQRARHGRGLRGGREAPGLVPDSAAGLLDGASRYQVEPGPAHAHRSMPGERVQPRAFAIPGVSVPRLWPVRAERVVARRCDESPGLPDGAGVAAPRAKARDLLFHAGGREAESKRCSAGSWRPARRWIRSRLPARQTRTSG